MEIADDVQILLYAKKMWAPFIEVFPKAKALALGQNFGR